MYQAEWGLTCLGYGRWARMNFFLVGDRWLSDWDWNSSFRWLKSLDNEGCLDLLSHHGILLPASFRFLLGLAVDKLRWNFKFCDEKSFEWMVSRLMILFLQHLLFFWFLSKVKANASGLTYLFPPQWGSGWLRTPGTVGMLEEGWAPSKDRQNISREIAITSGTWNISWLHFFSKWKIQSIT